MKITKIIQRDLAGRTIVVECPNCGGPLALRPSVITNLEDGIDAIGRCEYCSETLEMSVAALGGRSGPTRPDGSRSCP
jgi:hypothetical protein